MTDSSNVLKIRAVLPRTCIRKTTVTKQNYLQEFERLESIKNGILTNNFGEINITSPTIISNGHTLDNLKTPIILRKTKDKLKTKRIELIDMLNKIKNKVIDYNQESINEYQTTLESKPISRVLSK